MEDVITEKSCLSSAPARCVAVAAAAVMEMAWRYHGDGMETSRRRVHVTNPTDERRWHGDVT
jgi:hypothetical protein